MTPAAATRRLAVIGAGPAGMMAAYAAASAGARVVLLERNAQAGKKLLLTGGGRCNLTRDGVPAAWLEAYFGAGKFLYPALHTFSNHDTIDWFAQQGVPVQRTASGKIFPRSDRAADVRDALLRACRTAGVEVWFDAPVRTLAPAGEQGFLLTWNAAPALMAAAVVVATGGLSYPATGSTGDGLRWMEALGVPVIAPRPALAPLRCADTRIATLAGVTLDPVRATLLRADTGATPQAVERADGALLFTHQGVSGPVILRLSRALPAEWEAKAVYVVALDLLPTYTHDALVAELTDRARTQPRKTAVNAWAGLLPASLLLVVLRQALSTDKNGDPRRPVAQCTKQQIQAAAAACKRFQLRLAAPARYERAMATAGGIARAALNPRTMAVRPYPGLFAAGEVIDVDGDSGGYNLQAAFSTGWLAGQQAARYVAGVGSALKNK